jgi:hypothetical protein
MQVSVTTKATLQWTSTIQLFQIAIQTLIVRSTEQFSSLGALTGIEFRYPTGLTE